MRESFTASFHLSLDEEEGILRVFIKDGARISHEEMKTYTELAERLIGKKNDALILVDATGSFFISASARACAATNSRNRKGIAFVNHSLVNWFIFCFYKLFNRPACPTRIFNSEEKALAWLKSIT